MKFVKSISLFFLYPLVMFCLGIYVGVSGYRFFYPGDIQFPEQSSNVVTEPNNRIILDARQSETETEMPESKEEFVETAKEDSVLGPDTEYVLQEMDSKSETMVEYVYKLPDKYFGMNRDAFVGAMDAYESAPPLKEIERGFLGLEVISFSAQRVVVQMNYAFIEPTDNFYLCVEGNYVTVYLEDKETVYMHTDILLDTLPETVQQQIISYMYVKGEEDLYHFLETYSS